MKKLCIIDPEKCICKDFLPESCVLGIVKFYSIFKMYNIIIGKISKLIKIGFNIFFFGGGEGLDN